jgi:hypothetical protein
MRVEEAGESILVYTLHSVAEAAELMTFLRAFLPSARFILEPLHH